MTTNPRAKKLKLDKTRRAAVVGAPENYLEQLKPLPDELKISETLTGEFDWIQNFVNNQQELAERLPKAVDAMAEQSLLWISFPKGSSGIQTDLTRDQGWQPLRGLDLRYTNLVAVDDTWSAISLRTYKPGEERKPNAFLRS